MLKLEPLRRPKPVWVTEYCGAIKLAPTMEAGLKIYFLAAIISAPQHNTFPYER